MGQCAWEEGLCLGVRIATQEQPVFLPKMFSDIFPPQFKGFFLC